MNECIGNSVNPVISNLKECIVDEQIKNWCTDYANSLSYSYDDIVQLENYLNEELSKCKIKFNKTIEKIDTGELKYKKDVPVYDGYGVLAETDIYDAIVKGIKNKKLTNINFIQEQNPNGKMKFPDYIIDKFWLDSKAVKCDKNKNGTYQAHYSNGLGDKDEIISILDKFFTNNTLDEKSSALIIYTYYFPLEDCVYNIKLKVVPLLFCIGVAEKNKGISVKWISAEDKKIKNSAVRARLCVKKGSYKFYLNNLKEALEYEKSKCIPRTVSTVS